MFRKLWLSVVLALVGLVALGTGCKSDEDKFCEAMRKLESSYSDEECKGDLEDIKRSCTNADEVISCAAAAETEDAMRDCQKKCKEKE
ncbi:MAG: hypothetical protein JXB32_25690 [Deltaproteobacteria bacterium]|nr:hypothetical protein [Deltaproteobacteria bacterium]